MSSRPSVVLCIVLAVGLLCGSVAALAADPRSPEPRTILKVGLSASIFSNVDVRDVEAAMEVLMEELVKKRQEDYSVEIEVFDDFSRLFQTLDREQLHVVCLPAFEFLAFRESHYLEPAWVFQIGGQPVEEYAILVRHESGLESVGDLTGCQVALPRGVMGEIAALWLNDLLREAEGSMSLVDIGGLLPMATSSKAILRVFFSQSEACVVPAQTFDLVVELNPQVGRELRVLKRSPGLLRAVLCFSREMDAALKREITDFATTMHEDAEGRQVLVMQQVERVVPFSAWMIEPLREIYERRPAEWERMSQVKAIRNGGAE